MYSTIEEFIKDWDREAGLTQKVIDTMTDTSLQQQIYPDGRNLGKLAWHVTISIPGFLSKFGFPVERVKNSDSVPSSAEKIAETFRETSSEVAETAKQEWTDESLKEVQDAFGRDLPNGMILSLLIRHIIHHRGQMTVLMRQAGLKIPGVYGPAREEWRQMGEEPPEI